MPNIFNNTNASGQQGVGLDPSSTIPMMLPCTLDRAEPSASALAAAVDAAAAAVIPTPSSLNPTTPTAAAVPTSTQPPAVAVPVRRIRMAYKSRGIRATKAFFIDPIHSDTYSTMPESIYADGEVLAVPNKEKLDYVFRWNNTSSLPAEFPIDHLRAKMFKNDNKARPLLVAARNTYDDKYPDKPYPSIRLGSKSKSKSKTSSRASVSISAVNLSQERITNIRMAPSPVNVPAISQIPPVDANALYNVRFLGITGVIPENHCCY